MPRMRARYRSPIIGYEYAVSHEYSLVAWYPLHAGDLTDHSQYDLSDLAFTNEYNYVPFTEVTSASGQIDTSTTLQLTPGTTYEGIVQAEPSLVAWHSLHTSFAVGSGSQTLTPSGSYSFASFDEPVGSGSVTA